MRSPCFVLLFVLGCAGPARASGSRPWLDPSFPPPERAARLVGAMTLDEKILEIHMMDVPAHPREVPGIPRLGIPPFKITNGPVGAGPGDRKPVQPATAMPSAIALAASWDPALAARYGKVIGEEVADRGEDLIEGPGVNIARVPLNGRNFEYLGEDPYLASRLAVPEIRAIERQGVVAEVKHFAANNQEKGRKTINEVIDERTLREIYLPAFEAAVQEGGADAVMAAYPSINGQFGCENVHLLHDILRDEWGFTGFVQSDYTATRDAVRSAHAGLDLSMKADHYGAEMKRAVLAGRVSAAALDSMLVRRFTVMFRYGLFDHPRAPRPIPAKRDGQLSRMIADQTAVLLKNESGCLPLRAGRLKSIALIGPYSGTAHTGGRGSSHVEPLYTVPPIRGLRERTGPLVDVSCSDGRDISASVAAARAADVAIVIAGNTDGEGKDRTSLGLPDHQDRLISAVADANPNTVVVLETGGAVLMPWLGRVAAVLETWYPGEEDGHVLADLLFGDANPSGRLPVTFPRKETDVATKTPAQYPGIQGTARYSERLLVGYRWYDAKHVTPLFPFGFGLSYTTFTMDHLRVGEYARGRPTAVEVDVANTGERAGAEVVQAYVAAPANAGEPPKRLEGFAKVSLRPHETRTVRLMLDPRAFSIWNTSMNRWTVVPGMHEVLVGDSSRDLPLRADIAVKR